MNKNEATDLDYCKPGSSTVEAPDKMTEEAPGPPSKETESEKHIPIKSAVSNERASKLSDLNEACSVETNTTYYAMLNLKNIYQTNEACLVETNTTYHAMLNLKNIYQSVLVLAFRKQR